MDKRTVIKAYYQGELTLQECAQILGIELHPLVSWMKQEEQSQCASKSSEGKSKQSSPKWGGSLELHAQQTGAGLGSDPIMGSKKDEYDLINPIHKDSNLDLYKPIDWWYWS